MESKENTLGKVSSCCGDRLILSGDYDEGTYFWKCFNCNKPCDQVPDCADCFPQHYPFKQGKTVPLCDNHYTLAKDTGSDEISPIIPKKRKKKGFVCKYTDCRLDLEHTHNLNNYGKIELTKPLKLPDGFSHSLCPNCGVLIYLISNK